MATLIDAAATLADSAFEPIAMFFVVAFVDAPKAPLPIAMLSLAAPTKLSAASNPIATL